MLLPRLLATVGTLGLLLSLTRCGVGEYSSGPQPNLTPSLSTNAVAPSPTSSGTGAAAASLGTASATSPSLGLPAPTSGPDNSVIGPVPSTPAAPVMVSGHVPQPTFDASMWLTARSTTTATAPTDPNAPGLYRADGSRWMGRGAVITDARACDRCTLHAPNPTEALHRVDYLVDQQGATLLRLMLMSFNDPKQFNFYTNRLSWESVLFDDAYAQSVVDIVNYIGHKKNVYVLLSLWRDQSFVDPTLMPTLDSADRPGSTCAALAAQHVATTSCVWQKLATLFKDYPYVIFGIHDEYAGNYDGAEDAQLFTAYSGLTQTIRDVEAVNHGRTHIVSVPGTRSWARGLQYYAHVDAQGVATLNPITAGGRGNIVYETHPYATADQYPALFANAAKFLPVLIGECGPNSKTVASLTSSDGNSPAYNDTAALLSLAESMRIPYLAWSLDPACGPLNMMSEPASQQCDGSGYAAMQLTPWGTWFFAHMRRA